MFTYVLICILLSLAGIAGLQFFYMIYLEKIGDERKKKILELERHCKELTNRLKDSETLINNQVEYTEVVDTDVEIGEQEVWADIIEDR